MARKLTRSDEWLLGRFKRRFSKRQWMALFGGHPSILGGGASSPLLTGLVSYWKLNETTGNRLDSVGTRTMVPQGTVGYAAGKLGNCATFAGSPNYLLTAVDASLLSINWALGFTVTKWVYIPTAFVATTSVSKATGSDTGDWVLGIFAMNSLRFWMNDSVSGDSIANKTDVTLSADTWYFFCGRYNPATKKAGFSLNGGTNTLGNALANGPKNSYNQLRINRYSNAYGTAYYDSVGIWSRYLSDAEVLQLYNAGNGLDYPF